MSEIPIFSPGCFGSAIAFKKDDVVCSNCPFVAQCEPVHRVSLQTLRDRFGVKTTREIVSERAQKREAVQAAKKAAPVDPTLLTVPKKVRELLERLDRGSYDVVGKLKRGENPFGAAIPYMMVACHLLINFQTPVDQKFLSTAFVRKLGWQKNTADAHARMAIQALTHVGAVENNDGLIRIRKD